MRPPSGDQDMLYSSLLRGRVIKRREKRSRVLRTRKRKNQNGDLASPRETLALYPRTFVHQLRDKSKEEEEKFKLVAHVQAGIVIQGPSESASDKIKPPRHEEIGDRSLASVPKPERSKATLPQAWGSRRRPSWYSSSRGKFPERSAWGDSHYRVSAVLKCHDRWG